ncbi:hypothetical protein GW796_08675 [archaeon]|nr:hypothetical protein [archaeon]NCQ51952.1 hypothetical protein [archaeon]
MPSDYDKTVTSISEIFDMMGFEYDVTENGDISITGYDSKTGKEELFFLRIPHLIPSFLTI